MLRPANVVDLPVLRALIREGAATGSFDRELATESRNAARFFVNLRQALATGYFVEEDPRTGRMVTFAAPAFVYVPDDDRTLHRPIGFGLFKAATVGYELWLTGIDATRRGKGAAQADLYARIVDSYFGERHVSRNQISTEKEHLYSRIGAIHQFEISNIQISKTNRDAALVTFDKTWDFGDQYRFSGSARAQLTLNQIGGSHAQDVGEEPLGAFPIVREHEHVADAQRRAVLLEVLP